MKRGELRAFALYDLMVAIVLAGILVLVVFSFVRETLAFSTYISRHQVLRQETFALVNRVLPALIREASAIDYEESTEERLSLYIDKFEREKLVVYMEADEDEGISRLVLEKGSEKVYLNSPQTYISSFELSYSVNPKTVDRARLQDVRAFQPMVAVTVRARSRRPDGARGREKFTFYEDPRISYSSAYTLRNYSLSNLR